MVEVKGEGREAGRQGGSEWRERERGDAGREREVREGRG